MVCMGCRVFDIVVKCYIVKDNILPQNFLFVIT